MCYYLKDKYNIYSMTNLKLKLRAEVEIGRILLLNSEFNYNEMINDVSFYSVGI